MPLPKLLCTTRHSRIRFLRVVLLIALILLFVLNMLRPRNTDKMVPKPYSKRDMSTFKDHPFVSGCQDPFAYIASPQYRKSNASFVMLTRNQEIEGVVKSMQSIERHFNQWFQYPYVFLNDEPFDSVFRDTVGSLTTAEVRFGEVGELDWEFPQDVRDTLRFKHSIEDQGDRGIMYGNMESYHKMCRFYSGIFYKHPLVQEYEWYWRIEPDVEFFCDITYDPFVEMENSGKKYGFTVLIKELYWTVPNLFRFTKSFIKQNNVKVGKLWKLFTRSYKIISGDDHLSKFINHGFEVDIEISKKVEIDYLLSTLDEHSDDESIGEEELKTLIDRARRKTPIVEDKFEDEEYNLCHFWSNFEIARVDVFDNELYNAYFKYLEETGGFWSERWGDAPVHSLGLALSLDASDIHYFRDIGYQHSTLAHCPANKLGGQLPYRGNDKYEKDIFPGYSDSFNKFWKIRSGSSGSGKDYGCGCRCRCPRTRDIEDSSTECPTLWFNSVQDNYAPQEPLELGFLEKSVKSQFLEVVANRA